MSGSQATTTFDALFAGPGEVRALCRSMDWGKTPVGPVQSWPPSLRTAVSICLDARMPMAIWAVPGLTLIYNDSYAGVLGPSKHPSALGRNARNVLSQMCKQLGPEVERVIEKGESVAHPEQRLLMRRAPCRPDRRWKFGPRLSRTQSMRPQV